MAPRADAHRFLLRVYYEDTDLAGIVYYANYLKFIERARSEAVRDLGIDQGRLRADHGLVFAVRHLSIDYLAPARFDDQLIVTTSLDAVAGASVTLMQEVWRGDVRLIGAVVKLVLLHESGKVRRFPPDIRRALAGLGGVAC